MIRIGASILAVSVALTAAAAAAQDRPASASPPGQSDSDRNDDIVITAQKREQNAQDVGLSIVAIDGKQLRENGAASADQIASAASGVQVYSYLGGQPTFVVRGIGVQDYSPNTAPAAAVYLDEVYLGSNIVSGFQLFDTARVEVLKGPQGDLFGRNTTGGAISFTTNRPTDKFSGYVEGALGNYRTTSLNGAISGPLSKTLSVRVAGTWSRQAKGFYTNVWTPASTSLPLSPLYFNPKRNPGETESWAARTLVRWEPAAGVSFLLNVHGGEKREDVIPMTPIGFTSIPGAVRPCGATSTGGNYDPRYCGDVFGYTDTDGDPYRVDVDFVGRNRQSNFGTSLRGEISLGALTLTSITAYEKGDKTNTTDTDGSPNHEMNQVRASTLRQVTQELRLSSDPGKDFYWIFGLYGASETIRQRFFGTLSPLLGFTNFSDPATSSRVATELELNFRQKSLTGAVFGHVEWKLADTVTLTAGLRYSYERKDFFSQSEWIYGDGLTPQRVLVNFGSTPADAALVNERVSFESVSGKIGLNYKPSDRILLYANVSRGAKSGGFDGDFAFTRAQLQPFKDEKLTAYEVGWKATLLDRKLYFNGSAFYYDFKDPQVRVAQVDPVTHLPFNQLRNIAAARVYGADLDLDWRATRRLDLKAGLSLNDSRIKDPAQAVFNGNRLPLASPVSATFSARYQRTLAHELKLTALVDGKYSGAFYLNPENTSYLRQHPYALVNGRLALADGDRWEIAAWVKNLTQQTYAVQAFALFGAYPVAYSPPRTYGISLRYAW